jgi:integrin alpha FG-GAP repeat containing protein 1
LCTYIILIQLFRKSFDKLISSNNQICDKSHQHSLFPISSPHSSAFVDIDGDCINDMVISSYSNEIITDEHSKITTVVTKKFLEIWRGVIEDNKLKYCLTDSSVYELDPSLGLFSIVDIDRDSLLDIVFPVVNSSPPKILVAYNKVKLEYDWTEDYCATHKPLNLNDANPTIPLLFEDFKIDKNTHDIQTILLDDSDKKIFHSANSQVYLRFADINIDSYQDFTVVLHDKKDDFTSMAYVFLNAPIKYELNYSGPIRRTFAKDKTYVIPSITNALHSSFFDLDENGKLDLIVVYEDSNNKYSIAGFFNTYNYDSYYIKSITLNKNNVFYSNELGASYRFITTNIDGSRRMDSSVQAIQVNTPNSLNLPYSYFGIGRSNNYIENFHVISGNYLKVLTLSFYYNSLKIIIKYLHQLFQIPNLFFIILLMMERNKLKVLQLKEK